MGSGIAGGWWMSREGLGWGVRRRAWKGADVSGLGNYCKNDRTLRQITIHGGARSLVAHGQVWCTRTECDYTMTVVARPPAQTHTHARWACTLRTLGGAWTREQAISRARWINLDGSWTDVFVGDMARGSRMA